MPTLEEMRAWLQGNKVESLPDRDPEPESENGKIIVLDPNEVEVKINAELARAERITNDSSMSLKVDGYIVHPGDTISVPPEVYDKMRRVLDRRREPHSVTVTTPTKFVRRKTGAIELRFGRFRGEALEDVAESSDGMDYLGWIIRHFEGDPETEELRDAIKAIIHPLKGHDPE